MNGYVGKHRAPDEDRVRLCPDCDREVCPENDRFCPECQKFRPTCDYDHCMDCGSWT